MIFRLALTGLLIALPPGRLPAPSEGEPAPEVQATLAVPALLDIVPADGVSVWHKHSSAQTALLDAHAMDVVDTIMEARFDELLMDSLDLAGVDGGLMAEVHSFRNVVTTIGALVPWREMVRGEFVYAESGRNAFGGEVAVPGLLFACRPDGATMHELERTLAALYAGVAVAIPVHMRYDIHDEPRVRLASDSPDSADDSPGSRSSAAPTGVTTNTRRYRVVFPAGSDIPVLELAFHEDTILLGLGEPFFEQALDLLRGGQGPRLADEPRFVAAFDGLPEDAAFHRFVDVRARIAAMKDVAGLLATKEFNGGTLQSLLNESFRLFDHVDTVATAARCHGDQLLLETMTRFDASHVAGDGMLTAGIARPASAAILDYVPAQALAFDMRGEVDLVPVWRQAMAGLQEGGGFVGEMLWMAGVLGAAADFSIERDLLSWMGSEHVVVTLPARGPGTVAGQTDTVVLWQLEDAHAAKKCLSRLEAVCVAAGPRILGGFQELLAEIDSELDVDMTLAPADGMYPMLNEVALTIQGVPMVQGFEMSYGVLGKTVVLTTSERALETCLATMVGEEDGLADHALASHLSGRDDLTSARLHSYGKTIQELQGLVALVGAVTGGILGPLTAGTQAGWVPDQASELLGKVGDVIGAFDFLGDAVTWSESRSGGQAHYECTAVVLEGRHDVTVPATGGDPLVFSSGG